MGYRGNIIVGGIYRHYKNKDYRVICRATDTETNEDVVVYQALYDDRRTWVRPVKMFVEDVEVDGKMIPRFRFILGGVEITK